MRARGSIALAGAFGAALGLAAPAAHAVRPDQPGAPAPAFASTDHVETFASPGGTFLIHYTRAGANAVPSGDADGNGTPDYVEETAQVYDAVLAFYRDMRGFRAPPSDMNVAGSNGGDGRFDVYLVDFPTSGADGAFRQDGCDPARDTTCTGYMVQENDFVEFSYPSTRIATQTLASHEFFHGIQAGYDVRRGAILEESTATWATEQFQPTLSDFEAAVTGYLNRPDRSLDQVQTGPVDQFAYGVALWFQFLTERHDPAVVRATWTACGMDDGATGWLDLLDGVLRRDYASSFAAEFSEFAVWNLYTAARANATRAYDNGTYYAPVATTAAALPYAINQVRLFHASARYYASAPGERASLTAALIPQAGAGADALDGLSLRIAARRGNMVGEPHLLASASAGTEAVDVGGATEAILVVTNASPSGASRTPGLCFGSVDEVAACRASMGAGGDDAGAGDGGATNEGGVGDGGAGGTPGGCACTARGSARATDGGAMGLASGAVALAGILARRGATRRRRARPRARR